MDLGRNSQKSPVIPGFDTFFGFSVPLLVNDSALCRQESLQKASAEVWMKIGSHANGGMPDYIRNCSPIHISGWAPRTNSHYTSHELLCLNKPPLGQLRDANLPLNSGLEPRFSLNQEVLSSLWLILLTSSDPVTVPRQSLYFSERQTRSTPTSQGEHGCSTLLVERPF